MNTEDEAFVRAIRATPDDVTTRLVYADWLDDRGDPRGEYLRIEAAWIALQPNDPQYRPLFRSASERAATLDPEWFASVSRMGHLVRQAWEPISAGFEPREPVPDLPGIWEKALGPLRALYAEAFGVEEVDRRFCAPADFAAFLCVVGGRADGWNSYCGAESLVAVNRTGVDTFSPARPPPDYWTDEEVAEKPEHPEIWLEFGGWSDKHWYFVCCDLESPLFGVVAEGEDYHPWMAGIEPLDFRGRNLLQFLTGYLPSRRNRDRSAWPRVPHGEWATH